MNREGISKNISTYYLYEDIFQKYKSFKKKINEYLKKIIKLNLIQKNN